MSKFLWILLFAAFIASLAQAQQTAIPSRPRLSVDIEPRRVKTQGGYVQGQIVLRVQLVSPHPFEALQLTLPPIAKARALTLSPPRTREIHNYGLKGYLYETKLALFPEQSGTLTIPSIAVVGAVAIGSGRTASFAEVKPAMPIAIKPIDPSYDAPWWLVAEAIAMTEIWTPAPDTLSVGDIVRREITVTAHGVTAEHLPNIEQPDDRGYSVVGSEATAKTGLTPDGAVAILRQVWDLRIESEAVMAIAPIQLPFWDPATGAIGVASLPARRIEPLPRQAEARRAQLMREAMNAHRNRRMGLFAVLSLPALALLALAGALLYTWLPTRADRRLSQSCAANATPAMCFRAVAQWSRASFDAADGNLMDRLQQICDGEAAVRLHTLQLALFAASGAPLEPRRLARALIAAARRRRLDRFKCVCVSLVAEIVCAPRERVQINM